MSQSCNNIWNSVFGCVKTHPYIAGALFLCATVAYFRRSLFRTKRDVLPIRNPVLNRVYLFQFAAVKGQQISPFCLKLETYLRVMGIDYVAIEDFQLLSRFSRGKLPVIQYNHELIQDSEACINFLEQTVAPSQAKQRKSMDDGISEKEKAMTTLVKSLLEQTVTPLVVYYRWIHSSSWEKFKQLVFGKIPFPLSFIIPMVARKGVIRKMRSAGTSLYSEDELLAQASSALDAVSSLLGKNKFFFGDKFHTVDLVMYGVLSQITLFEMDSPLTRLATRYDSLITYCKNVREMVSKFEHKTLPISQLGKL